MSSGQACRFCSGENLVSFVDLGVSPPSNAFLRETDLPKMERFYPLHAFVCDRCLLVQLEEFESPEQIFNDYVYFSSYSTSWLAHCERYCNTAIKRLALSESSLVMELASNDGYLLQYFLKKRIPVIGIEPAANVAKVAIEAGIPTEVSFFGKAKAEEMVLRGKLADLIVANNVLAHVPDINDFVAGIEVALGKSGTVTFEFPHLFRLIESNQYDTIYHEHFSYLSLMTVQSILSAHELRVYDVEELSTHGGSIRVWACHRDAPYITTSAVSDILKMESGAGMDTIDGYRTFSASAEKSKWALLRFLIEARESDKRVAAYGAAAKGTTLLNYCGVRTDMVEFVCDRNPHKQGKYMPGCRVPVRDPKVIAESQPDYVLILPWNLRDEISGQLDYIRSWGGKFVVPIPTVEVF